MRYKLFFMILMLLMVNKVHSQTHSTKEAKVILVVDSKSGSVTHMNLFAKVQQMDKAELLKYYPNGKFYIGLLRGSYDLKNNVITPSKNSTITMYIDKQFFPTENFLLDDELSPGDEFNIGDTKTKVVSSKKGELTLKTN